MKFKTNMMIFCLTTLLVAISCNYLDREIAIVAFKLLSNNKLLNHQLAEIQDNLSVIVIGVSTISFCIYLYRITVGKRDSITGSFLLLAMSVPLSYVTKTWFKYVFGRIDPHQWIITPALYGFHWFNGGNFQGFPSGHMTVFTTFAAVLWRHHPRHRKSYLVFLMLLAGALIVTDYHFMSDVIAGTYLGLLVEVATFRTIRWVSNTLASKPLRLSLINRS